MVCLRPVRLECASVPTSPSSSRVSTASAVHGAQHDHMTAWAIIPIHGPLCFMTQVPRLQGTALAPLCSSLIVSEMSLCAAWAWRLAYQRYCGTSD